MMNTINKMLGLPDAGGGSGAGLASGLPLSSQSAADGAHLAP